MAKKKAASKKSRRKASSGKKTLRAAIVGVGSMGQGHCNSIKKVRNMQLVAVCDIVPGVAEMVGKKHNVPCYTAHKDMLKNEDIDVVIISTPHPSHTEVAIDSFKAGAHVITEKPISERISTAEKMVKAARKHRKKLAVMFQRRFEPAIEKAIDIVRSGKIGEVYRTVMISPEFRTQAYYDSGGWRATWRGEGGGVMMNQAPHVIDIFVQLAGMPSKVRGDCQTLMHHIEVEDRAEAWLTYKNGATGYFYCSTCDPAPGQMIEVLGDKGKLIWRDGTLRLIQFPKGGLKKFIKSTKEKWGKPSKEVEIKIKDRSCGHWRVMENMARCLLKGEELKSSGESGLDSLDLTNAIMLSSWTGEEVKLPTSRRKYDQYLADLRKKSKFKKKVSQNLQTDPNH